MRILRTYFLLPSSLSSILYPCPFFATGFDVCVILYPCKLFATWFDGCAILYLCQLFATRFNGCQILYPFATYKAFRHVEFLYQTEVKQTLLLAEMNHRIQFSQYQGLFTLSLVQEFYMSKGLKRFRCQMLSHTSYIFLC